VGVVGWHSIVEKPIRGRTGRTVISRYAKSG
jgi:hypothetical protein